MRFPVENPRQGFGFRCVRGLIALSLAAVLGACGMVGAGADAGGLINAAALPANGPQADYPVLVGEPFQIRTITHRPNDTLNYDEVGYLAVDNGAVGITGSHHTLPVPSYAEVTSLTTGRTILVRLERRGPMSSNHLLALSPAAMSQLDASAETPIRIRRVNPPEEQRALLRAGNSAPLRMDTPMPLVAVLLRRLPASATAMIEVPVEAIAAPAPPAPSSDVPPLAPMRAASPAPAPVRSMAPVAATGGFVVQVGAFSSEVRARSVAAAIGGIIVPSGNLFRVRTGPFANRGAAEASLANVRAAGYSDARILTGG